MPLAEKDRLAAEVEEPCLEFQDDLSDKRYPLQAFRNFWEQRDPLFHRAVVGAVNGLAGYLTVERQSVLSRSM
jgi:hypothetical protein